MEGKAEGSCNECDVVLGGILGEIFIVRDCNEGIRVSDKCFIKVFLNKGREFKFV